MTDTIQKLISKLEQQGGEPSRPASARDIDRAQTAGFPDEILNFYRVCEPKKHIEFQQRIWSIENALIENTDAIPGIGLYPHGYIVFASTLCGDAYCLDTNVTQPNGHHPIVLFSHESIEEDADLTDIQPFRIAVAGSFDEFLTKFMDGSLQDDPFED